MSAKKSGQAREHPHGYIKVVDVVKAVPEAIKYLIKPYQDAVSRDLCILGASETACILCEHVNIFGVNM